MIKDFKKRLQGALNIRRQAELPNLVPIFSAVVILTLLYCILSVYIVPSDKPPEFNFQDEGGAITALSALYIALACGFAAASNMIHFRSEKTHQWLWVILAAGLAFLAFDELAQFHERFGRIVKGRIMPSGFFRNWNDVIVIMYGVVALPVGLFLLTRLLRYKMVPELLAAAFMFYVVHTVIDSTQEPPTLGSIIFEESAKLFSAAFLAIGTFAGLIGNIWKYVETKPEVKVAEIQANNAPVVTTVEAKVPSIHLAN